MDNNTNIKAPTTTDSFDFGRFMRQMARNWWLFILSFIVCFGILFLYLRKTPPKYLVSSTVLVEDDSMSAFTGVGSSKGNSMLKSMMGGGDVNIYNEIEIMGSESLLSKAVAELGINNTYLEKVGFMKKTDHYGDSPIEVEAPKEVFDTLSASLTFKIKTFGNGKADIVVKKGLFSNYAELTGATLPASVKTPFGIFVVKTTRFYKPHKDYDITAKVSGNIPAAIGLQKDMSIELKAKKTDIIYMDVMDSNVKRGKDVLTTLARLYNERGMKEKDAQGLNTSKFIDERLSLIYRDLMGSEAEIEAYKKAHNIIDPETQGKAMIGKEAATESAIVAYETQYRIVGMIKNFLNNPANRNSLVPFEADSISAGSVKAYNNLVSKRMHLEESAKDGNQALQELDQQISTARTNLLNSVNNAMQAIRIKIDKVSAVNSETNGKLNELPTAERETRDLYRDEAIQNELYIFLLQKREENALKMAAVQPKGKIVDEAFASDEPIKPKKPLCVFVALIFALLLPFGIMYLKKALKSKISSQDELDALTQAHVLGQVYHAKRNALLMKDNDNSTNAEMYRYIRGNVQFMLPEETDKVVLVSSCTSGEGKSTVAANVATSFALLGKKVALVDANIRKPKQSELLGLQDAAGITSYLSSDMALSEIVQTTAEGLDVYVGGTVPPNPSELLQCSRAQQLFDELREQYDVVVVDSASLAKASDTFSLAKFADETLCVVRANSTKKAYVKWLNKLIEGGKLKNVGIVVNDVKKADDNAFGFGKDQK